VIYDSGAQYKEVQLRVTNPGLQTMRQGDVILLTSDQLQAKP
jgi:ASC-1-like (ASCH) protein